MSPPVVTRAAAFDSFVLNLTPAMMALALVPAMAVEQAFAAEPTFVGSVYYPVLYDENGTVEDKQTWVEDGFLFFETSHFSDYVVTGVPPKDEGGQPVAPPAGGLQPLAPSDGGSNAAKLAPTGDPLGTAAPVAAVLACLAAAAIACVRRKAR